MSVYNGFAAAKQQDFYMKLVSKAVHMMTQRILSFYLRQEMPDELKWVKQFRKIHKVLKHMDQTKYADPKFSQDFEELQAFLKNKYDHEVTSTVTSRSLYTEREGAEFQQRFGSKLSIHKGQSSLNSGGADLSNYQNNSIQDYDRKVTPLKLKSKHGSHTRMYQSHSKGFSGHSSLSNQKQSNKLSNNIDLNQNKNGKQYPITADNGLSQRKYYQPDIQETEEENMQQPLISPKDIDRNIEEQKVKHIEPSQFINIQSEYKQTLNSQHLAQRKAAVSQPRASTNFQQNKSELNDRRHFLPSVKSNQRNMTNVQNSKTSMKTSSSKARLVNQIQGDYKSNPSKVGKFQSTMSKFSMDETRSAHSSQASQRDYKPIFEVSTQRRRIKQKKNRKSFERNDKFVYGTNEGDPVFPQKYVRNVHHLNKTNHQQNYGGYGTNIVHGSTQSSVSVFNSHASGSTSVDQKQNNQVNIDAQRMGLSKTVHRQRSKQKLQNYQSQHQHKKSSQFSTNQGSNNSKGQPKFLF